jgi:hypothetical protein
MGGGGGAAHPSSPSFDEIIDPPGRLVQEPLFPVKLARQASGGNAMPWTPEDAPRHTKKAASERLRQLWAEVANKVLEETGDEGRAIRQANAVVARAVRGGEEG